MGGIPKNSGYLDSIIQKLGLGDEGGPDELVKKETGPQDGVQTGIYEERGRTDPYEFAKDVSEIPGKDGHNIQRDPE